MKLSFPRLTEFAEFAPAVPESLIILNHIRGVSRSGIYANLDDEVIPAWREGSAPWPACPNVTCKLEGMGIPRWGFGWHITAVPIGSENLSTISEIG